METQGLITGIKRYQAPAAHLAFVIAYYRVLSCRKTKC